MALYHHRPTPEQYKKFGFSTKPNSPFIQLLLTVDGKRYPFSTGTADYKEAMTFRAQKQVELEAGETSSSKGKMESVFANYVAYLEKKENGGLAYKKLGMPTSKRVASVIKCHLGPFFSNKKISEVKNQIDAYDDRRQGEGASAPALNGEWRILSAAMNKGKEKKLVAAKDLPESYPLRHIEEKAAAREGVITPEQYANILPHLPPHLKVFFAVAYETGIRPKEMWSIRPEEVFLDKADLKNCKCGDNGPHFELRTGETKNGAPRTAQLIEPTQNDVIELLKEWRKNRPASEWFFNLGGRQFIPSTHRKAWAKALKAANMPKGMKFYDTRRSASTNMPMDTPAKLRKMKLGHITDSEMEKYDRRRDLKEFRAAMTPKETIPAPAVAPAASDDDVDAKLMKLKQRFEGGLIPEDIYKAKVAALIE